MTREEFLYFKNLVQHNRRKGMTYEECLKDIQSGESRRVPEPITIFRYYHEHPCKPEAKKAPPPREVKKRKVVRTIRSKLHRDPDASCRKLAKEVKCDKKTVKKYLKKELNLCLKVARKIPHQLSPATKRARVRGARLLREQLLASHPGGLRKVVTFDETWVFLENRPGPRYVSKGTRRRPAARQSQYESKVMLTVAFSAERVWGVYSLAQGETITGPQLIQTVLKPLRLELRKTHRKGPLPFRLHLDNAPAHRSKLVTAWLRKAKLDVLQHPPYSPDLSPCDYFFFGELKRWLTGRKFQSASDAEDKVRCFLTNLDRTKRENSIAAWPDRCARVIDSKGQYIL
jgi:histone-lysine N-methyltransferase SETMAR